MPRIQINENQFVMAFFHKLMSLPKNKGKNFMVPSLLQEGGYGKDERSKKMKGIDLIIGNQFFFQFKMCDRLISNGAKEINDGRLEKSFKPYFRHNIKIPLNKRQKFQKVQLKFVNN